MSVDPPLLAARGVTFSYGHGEVLRGVDLAVAAGQSVALLGPSGSGKTTLLHCLSGLIVPQRGDVRFRGQAMSALPEKSRSAVRLASFGYVFQHAELVPEFSLLDNISLPLEAAGQRRRASRDHALALCRTLGIEESCRRLPSQVSGGQAQRAAVARAVAASPSIVFADEPTGSLDAENGARVMTMLFEAVRSLGAALVLVTHDEQLAARCERQLRLIDGQISARDSFQGVPA